MNISRITKEIQKLSKLFQVEQNCIINLSKRSQHPLPLPPCPMPHESNTFSMEYLKTLNAWVQTEGETTSGKPCREINLSRAARSIQEMLKSDTLYDFRQHFPPGYFIG